MKRHIVLALLLGVGTLCLSVVGAQESAKVIEVEQLRDNLFVFRGEGGGGNVAVFVTTEGVVVVDSKNPGWGQPILDEIKTLTSNPVTTVINTHSHADHDFHADTVCKLRPIRHLSPRVCVGIDRTRIKPPARGTPT